MEILTGRLSLRKRKETNFSTTHTAEHYAALF